MCSQPAGPDGSPVICFTLFCLITTINSLFLQLISTNLFHPPTQNGNMAKNKRQNNPVNINRGPWTHTHTHFSALLRLRCKITKKKRKIKLGHTVIGCSGVKEGGCERITGRKALHYVLLFRYNHRMAITPRRHRARALTPGLMRGKCGAPATADNKQRH